MNTTTQDDSSQVHAAATAVLIAFVTAAKLPATNWDGTLIANMSADVDALASTMRRRRMNRAWATTLGTIGSIWVLIVLSWFVLLVPTVDPVRHRAAPILLTIIALTTLYLTALYLESLRSLWSLIALRAMCTAWLGLLCLVAIFSIGLLMAPGVLLMFLSVTLSMADRLAPPSRF